jgi:hypothetical protein
MITGQDLEAWRTFGAEVERLVELGERRTREAYRDHLDLVLEVGGVSEDHPLRELVGTIEPDIRGSSSWQMDTGELGGQVRDAIRRTAVARDLLATWKVTDELVVDGDLDDPWESFWQDVLAARRKVPEEAIELLPQVAAEAIEAAAHPTSVWPWIHTDQRASDVVGRALDELAGRTGSPRDELPPAPPLDDELVMILGEAAQAFSAFHEWMLDRAPWSRTLGRLQPWLRRPARV